jgi:hypothetical protein
MLNKTYLREEVLILSNQPPSVSQRIKSPVCDVRCVWCVSDVTPSTERERAIGRERKQDGEILHTMTEREKEKSRERERERETRETSL